MGSNRRAFPGWILVVIGVLLLLGSLRVINWGGIWPIFPLALGVAFYAGFFGRKEKPAGSVGLLMPGTILIILSLAFFYCNLVGWDVWERIWPIAPFSVGAGFFAMYYWGTKERGLLIPGWILVGISLIFYIIFSLGRGGRITLALVVIAAGVLLLISSSKSKRETLEKVEETSPAEKEE